MLESTAQLVEGRTEAPAARAPGSVDVGKNLFKKSCHNDFQCTRKVNFENLQQAAELDKKMGEVNELFVEARELIADALDSQGSTYFEDDLDDAQHAGKDPKPETLNPQPET